MSISDQQLLMLIGNKFLAIKFWNYVSIKDKCWLWKGIKFNNGYGRFSPLKGVSLRAHRVSFVLINKSLPENIIRHTCDIKHCVNPHHLLDGTHKENVQDAIQRGKFGAVGKKNYTHCIRGHEFTLENTYIRKSDGSKICKLCIYTKNRLRGYR